MTGNPAHPLAPLLRKLNNRGSISSVEAAAVKALPFTIRDFAAGRDIVREGDRPAHVCVMLNGLTCRVKIVGDGARQITSFHIPGDTPDLQSLFLHRMDHALTTVIGSRVALVPHTAVLHLITTQPRLGFLLWRDTLVDGSIFREWMCGIGRRPALVRIAHLICELFVRCRSVGLVDGMTMPFHLTQTNLGDAQGLSVVHVNRVIRELRQERLIEIANRRLTILDWQSLSDLADFDDCYLHLDPQD